MLSEKQIESRRLARKKWREKNVEKARKIHSDWQKKWRKENPELTKERDKERHIKYRENRNQYSKEYYKDKKDTPEYKEKRNIISNSYYYRNKKKASARNAVNKALRGKKIVKPEYCENFIMSNCICSGSIEAHHEDYDKPLDIVWLCKACHKKRHQAVQDMQKNKITYLKK